MHAVFANLMAGLLSFHALVGCCWLHAQSEPACERPADELAEATGCCGHHHQAPPCGEEQPAEESCPCCAEGHSSCAYLPNQKSKLDAPIAVAFLPAAILAVPVTMDAAISSSWISCWNTTGIEPPLRLHLAHCVLLI